MIHIELLTIRLSVHQCFASEGLKPIGQAKRFYWPYLGDGVEKYVKTFLICQENKVEPDKPVGLLT